MIAALVSLAVTIAATVYLVGREHRTQYFAVLAPIGNLVASTIIVAWRGAA